MHVWKCVVRACIFILQIKCLFAFFNLTKSLVSTPMLKIKHRTKFYEKTSAACPVLIFTTRWCNLIQNALIFSPGMHCWDLPRTIIIAINKRHPILSNTFKNMPRLYQKEGQVTCRYFVMLPHFGACMISNLSAAKAGLFFPFDLSSCQPTADQTRHVEAIYLSFRHSWRLWLFRQRKVAQGMHRQCPGGHNTTCTVSTTKLSHLY